MDIIRLFPTTVGIYKNTDLSSHPAAIEKVKLVVSQEHPLIKQNLKNRNIRDLNVENFYQSKSGIHHDSVFESISKYASNKALTYAIGCGFDIKEKDFYIADSWFNYSTGHIATHTPHTHSNSFLSAVYYLSAPAGSGSLYFLHPNMQVNSIDPDHAMQTVDNTTEFAIDPEEGLCVVFKSSSIHGVSSNLLENDFRISIAFNFNVRNLGEKSISSHYNGV